MPARSAAWATFSAPPRLVAKKSLGLGTSTGSRSARRGGRRSPFPSWPPAPTPRRADPRTTSMRSRPQAKTSRASRDPHASCTCKSADPGAPLRRATAKWPPMNPPPPVTSVRRLPSTPRADDTVTAMTDWIGPLSDVRFTTAEVNAVAAVYRSGWLSQGPKVAEFERGLRARRRRHAVAVSSATAALHLIYVAIGISRG